VLFGTIRPSATSMTLTWVIASVPVCGVTETPARSVAAAASRHILNLRSAMSCLGRDVSKQKSYHARHRGLAKPVKAQQSTKGDPDDVAGGVATRIYGKK
jgi:hypothetical protein